MITERERATYMEDLVEAITKLKAYIAELEAKADETTGKIMPVIDVGKIFGKRFVSINDYRSQNAYVDHGPMAAVSAAERACAQMWEQAQKDHEANAPAIANNLALRKRVKLFMANIGIPEYTHHNDWTGKRKTPKRVDMPSGYLRDIDNHIPVDDGWAKAQADHERFLNDIAAYKQKADQEQREQEAERKRVQKEEDQRRFVAAMVVKYKLDYSTSLDGIIDCFLSQNKYLRLAHFLRLNREDWNDGSNYAERGINGFAVETDVDREIVKNITDRFEDFEDGRVFRDCQWNYVALAIPGERAGWRIADRL